MSHNYDAKHIEPFKAVTLICSIGLLAISVGDLFLNESQWQIFLVASVGFYVRLSVRDLNIDSQLPV